MLKRLPKVMPLVLVAVLFALSAMPAMAIKPDERMTIVDVALAVNSEGPYAGQFDILISLVEGDEEVAGILTGNGQFTVFAPTDAAFEELLAILPPGALTPELINEVLKYHIAHGRRYAADVVESDRIRMLNRGFTFISFMDGMPYINESQIIATDIEADNGIIHAIDAVLLP